MFKITIIACGNKMPSWVNEGVKEYTKRLKEATSLNLVEIPLGKRSSPSDLSRVMEKEAELILSAIPSSSYVIAMAIDGKQFSSETLAAKVEKLQLGNSHVCFIIGGPEGLSTEVLARANEHWSLSQLTLPHPLVRIILLESLYRAWSIIQNHPYHK
ncbi:rRNA large subunit methyltransferase [Legionella quinlivanii]|uniref:Ribosomal RNA large subunit methyltransferase H n=1 Tax=Legionella quinlivanii TaxID=45073 RepID=A0A0W0Y3Z6_9GAMM|nr:23S rRNA (pseudouridine(1915)-N(3))-methyltransferase RlmH [Legionella quinlivanii]KTD51514.1 rRNA large subunit methyltransferase [Legionella quinlivanii]SEF57530.1 23S rRNA (pseudouridine1915-N3)-methyltransferase [Legionella quinlivanii DSM 21216]STY10960.1 rRNA large subunit methyltransferase [Legionella quinlivanii]